VGTLSGPGITPVSGQLSGTATAMKVPVLAAARFLSPFDVPAFASRVILFRPGSPAFLTVSLPVTTEVLIGPCRGFHVPHMSDAAGVGAPYGPGDGDALTVDGSQIDCHLPLPNGQSLHPVTRPVCGA